MRILQLSPWFRTLSQLWGQEFAAAGHEVLTVTKTAHMEHLSASGSEVIMDARPRTPAGWREWLRAQATVRAFDPDVVLAEQVRDVRFALLARTTPTVLMVHDGEPHDTFHREPWQRRMSARLRTGSVRRIVTFSRFVARQLSPADVPIRVVPLPSEMPDATRPTLVPAGQRRDFITFGRVLPYKNLDVVMAAWRTFKADHPGNDDRLIVLGAGIPVTLDGPDLMRYDEEYQFAGLVTELAHCKASIAFYRKGSQSGAQVLSMQVGCPALVSAVGGLPEYQIADLPCPDADDPAGLTTLLGLTADPVVSEALGRSSRSWYDEHYSVRRSGEQLVSVLEEVARR